MGLLDFIFGKTPKIEHEFFGTLHFHQDKRNRTKSYYSGKRHFSPSDETIEIGISGDVDGPTQEQIDFFKSIEANYPLITNSIVPLIEDEFGNWKEGFKINDFYSEFEPVYLTLPSLDKKPIIWEIVFESDHDRNHSFSLTMSDFEAKELLIDG